MFRAALLVCLLSVTTVAQDASYHIEYRIVGAVRHPSVFTGVVVEPMMLTHAIRIAGGPKVDADETAVRISHKNREDIRVDYGAIMRGERSDVQIELGDIIYVPFKQ